MKTQLLLLLIFLVNTPPLLAQHYLDLPAQKAVSLLKKEKRIKPILHYDEKGNCDIETYQYQYKSEFEKKLQDILALKEFEWIKINENQFVSNFKKQRLLEVFDEAPPYQLSILRTAWSQELYELLLKK
jgi:hypothetical protein